MTGTWVALLRGVNVGGHRRVPMAELRALLQDLGHDDVRTHLQSGNAVFRSPRTDPDALAAELHAGLVARLGVDAAVLVVSADDLAAAVAANPWPDRVDRPKQLHLCVLSGAPPDVDGLDRWAPDEVAVVGRAAYLWYVEGAGRSRLTLDALERRLGVTGTARNWTTATALVDLAR